MAAVATGTPPLQAEEQKQKAANDPSPLPAQTAAAAAAPPPTSLPPLPAFSADLQSALQEVLPSNDPLDSPTFDPITYINTAFPDESSLTGNKLDVFLTSLRRQVKHYNDIIIHDVRDHSCQRSVTRDAVSAASISITQLFNKIKQIKEKAKESEVMVQEICRDIRALDHAKQHLTSTIRALRNLHMLVSAVGQLDYMVNRKQYRDAARLIKAIDDLFSLFEQYQHIDKIKLLNQSVTQTKEIMKQQLTEEFHALIPTLQPIPKDKPTVTRYISGQEDEEKNAGPAYDADEQAHIRTQLADACALISVLETSFKHSLLLWFTSLLLREYNALYEYGKEGATLEQIERRYAWCRRMIHNYDDTYLSVFPNEWEVPLFVATQFTKTTKQQITSILTHLNAGKEGGHGGSKKGMDVNQMIKALTQTIVFERELTYNMKMRRAPEDRGVKLYGDSSASYSMDDGGEMEHADLVENIKMKYKGKIGDDNRSGSSSRGMNTPTSAPTRNKELESGNLFDTSGSSSSANTSSGTASGGSAAGTGTGASTRPALPPIDFHGSISDAFTPYMSAYVELERKSITEICDKVEREEKWQQPEESKARDRYGGSDDLFLYIKNSIVRVSKLTRNITFYHLFLEYKRGLVVYAEMLEKHLPRRTIDFTNVLNEREYTMACYTLNTAEYCTETIPMLEQQVKAKIDEQYKHDIDLSALIDSYATFINKCIQIMVNSVLNALTRILNNMSKNNWEAWQSVGDESVFVLDMVKVFKDTLPIIHAHMSPRFVLSFCNQLASLFIPKYVESIYRCKRIGEMGAQQMSLDAHSLKSTLLALPSLTQTEGQSNEDNIIGDDGHVKKPAKTNIASKSYTRYVNTEMSKAEALLKTLVSPTERLILTFKALLPKNTTDDLYRICTLRGMNKKEIQSAVDVYNASVGVEDQVKLNTSSAGAERGSGAAGVALSGLTQVSQGLGLTGKAPNLRSFISNLGASNT